MTSNINRVDWRNIIKGKNANLESIPIENILQVLTKWYQIQIQVYTEKLRALGIVNIRNGKDYYLLFKISLKIIDSLKKNKMIDSLK